MSHSSALHPVPTSETHYWAIGVIAVHLQRGSERLSIPGPWSIVSKLDQERRRVSKVPLWKYSTFTFQPAFCLLSRKLTEQQKVCQYPICSRSAVHIISGWWLQIAKMQTLLKHYLSLPPLKPGSEGRITWQNMSQFGLSRDAVRVRTTNEDQWSSGAVRSCVCSIWHFIPLPVPLSKTYLQAIWMRNWNSKWKKRKKEAWATTT